MSTLGMFCTVARTELKEKFGEVSDELLLHLNEVIHAAYDLGKGDANALAAQIEVLKASAQQLSFEIAHDPSEPEFKSFGRLQDVMAATPATCLAPVQAEAFVRGAVWEASRTKGGVVTIEDVREVARSLYNRIRQGGA